MTEPVWELISIQVAEADPMLAMYDAAAVADAMGLTFEDRAKTSAKRTFRSASADLIEQAVEAGLPRGALRHIAALICGGDKTRIAAVEWGVVPKTTLDRRDATLSPQESERTERVARLFVHAHRALGTDAEARDFMTAAHPELGGRRPLDSAKTDLGTRRTERILTALEYGLAL